MGSASRAPSYDAFSPPPPPGQADAFSPPPRQSPRSSPSPLPRLRSAPAPAPRAMSHPAPRRTGAAREVLDDELFGDLSPPPPLRPLGREVDDTELFSRGASAKHARRRKALKRKSRAPAKSVPDASSPQARPQDPPPLPPQSPPQSPPQQQTEGNTGAPPKRQRRMAHWEARRAALEAGGTLVTERTLAGSAAAYSALPWRVGREPAEYQRIGTARRLSEICLEAVRRGVRSGAQRNLAALPADFVYEILASPDVDAAALVRVEADNPALAPVVEAAWAQLCNRGAAEKVEELPTRFASWRHLHEFRLAQRRRALDEARQRVRESYRREAANGVRAMRVAEHVAPPTRRRRASSPTEPLTTLGRLRQQHRRAMNRPVSRR